MSSNTAKYPQPPFTQAIELYGDRAGSKGTFKFAGFAWIQRTKVILVQGDAHSLNSAAEWRCLLRLIALAHRLKKPILLWNLPVTHIAAIQRRTSLACAQTIQKTELELLRLPYPIITIFDEIDNVDHTAPELIWNDGIVLVASPDAQFSEQKKIKIAQHPMDIAPAILELLCQTEAVPATELIKNRRESLHFLVKS
jgi:hypothetical protein